MARVFWPSDVDLEDRRQEVAGEDHLLRVVEIEGDQRGGLSPP